MTAIVRLVPQRVCHCPEYGRRDQYRPGWLIVCYWRSVWTMRELRYRARGGRFYPPPRRGQIELPWRS